jgi:signal transduction histidine kinase
VLVALHVTESQVSLTVQDSGVGFVPAATNGQGLGLLGMRERAELLAGRFHLQAEAGKGTQIHVTIPLTKGERA